MNNKLTNSNNARNLIGICIAAGFAISAALTWKIPKAQKDLKK